jgi:hypothetical protein
MSCNELTHIIERVDEHPNNRVGGREGRSERETVEERDRTPKRVRG